MAGYNIISATQVVDRLDAEYYGKDLLENEQKLASFQQITLENTVKNEKNAIADLTSNGSFEFLRGIEFNTVSGIPFIRTQNLMDGYIDNQDMLFVSVTSKEKVSKSLCKTGDLVVCRKGKVGSASTISLEMDGAAISENVTRFRLKEDFDADFLSAFLNSKQGRTRFLREATGVIQKWINNEKLRQIKIIQLNNLVEEYIGDKVRQAERLREWAKSLRAEVDNELNQFKFATDLIPSTVNKVSTQTLEDRLDPRPYRNHYINLVEQIKKVRHSNISSLAVLNSGCSVSSSDFLEEKAVPLIRIRNIGYDDFIGIDTYISKSVYDEEGKYHAEENMIVIGMDGIFRAQFILAEELPMLINQRVAILKPNEIRSELLTYWLNRPEGQMQLNQWAVKTTVEHTSLSDIGRVLIPRLTQEVEDYLADKLRNARKALKASKVLVESAKYIVENLIEGTITEEHLIQVQNALEQGDTSLDRAILSQMTQEGYAVAGSKPLFSDLDEFYDLLEQAKVLE